MIIAVDFDGTIVEHKYPEIGRELPFAIETLKKLQQERHRLILWSVREGMIHDKWGYEDIYQSSDNKEENKKRSFWKILFSKM